ncbi:hypothetical protein NT6N_39330 [Oceaniferula spumae]|uniref:Cytochrome c domain-containing protein n=1 Tax=Oceaniferula spumae TaxID=2979115 RepID=A0AAT9FSH8_9BACT
MFKTSALLFLTACTLNTSVLGDTDPDVKLAEGFQLEKIYQVPKKTQGSWVSMTVDDQGRLITSDQYGGLFRITLKPLKVEPLKVKMGGAHGLLWFKGALYASVSENAVVEGGVYKVTDSDGDGELDQVELFKALRRGGEHGPHGLVASPDGEWIYVTTGNHSPPPADIDYYHGGKNWAEDHLLPRQPDARGHARTMMAPGGWVARFTPDGKRWELVSQGYRNAFGLAFNEHGHLFTYDSDMEWDFGTPWYRPTRICEVTSGSEYGWRNGTGKWPEYYLDSKPPVLDIGPGSPTGVVSGLGAKFPERYQRAIYALDWTFATIYAIHLQPKGASYVAEKEEFLTSTGLPVTDAVIGHDGAMYFLAGGRRTESALYRVSYTGNDSVAPVKPSKAPAGFALRDQLVGQKDLAVIWSALGHDDRAVRYAARVALEHLPISQWQEKVTAEKNPRTLCQVAVAVAHQGEKSDAHRMLEQLAALDFPKLNTEGKLELLRAEALLISRHGKGDADLIAQLDAHFPDEDESVNRELCRILSYLQSPTVVAKTLSLMAEEKKETPPDWAVLASRNARYGKDVIGMLSNFPSAQNMHYAYCLRVVKAPWTEEQRRQYFTWFSLAEQKSGGMSYKGFIKNIRKDALTNATEAERKKIAAWKLGVVHDPFKDLPPVKGPGKNWSVANVAGIKDLDKADLKNGERMFRATLCAACHSVGGQGGSAGPDLSHAAGRFQLKDFAEAIIMPDKTISDQYEFSLITKRDGTFVTGKVLDEKDEILIIATNAFDFSKTIEVARTDIKSIVPSPVSPMPPALINRLNKEELRDLMGYLMNLK